MSDDKIKLPCGFFTAFEKNSEGNVVYKFSREAIIKEMTGRIITELGSKRVRANPSTFTQKLLEQCLVSVGGKRLRLGQFDNILIADQDYITMKIRQLSKGDVVVGLVDCEKCGEKIESDINLNDLNVITLDPPSDEEMKEGFRFFTFEDKDLFLKAKFRYPMVMDTNVIGQILQSNPIEAHNRIMDDCLEELEIEGKVAKSPFPKKYIESLKIKYYESIRDGFLNSQPGVEMKIDIDCWSCGAENELEISAADFLISAPKKSKRTGQTQ